MTNYFKCSKSLNMAKVISLLLLLFVGILPLSAQSEIRGKVTDRDGEPLVGVTVMVKGLNRGVITGSLGDYSITAEPNDVLAFTFIGMLTEEVEVGSKAIHDVIMEDDVAMLDQTVVVAYGTQKRASLTGAISIISDDEILKAPTMSVSNIIGSRVAGISAVQSSGQPGSDFASLMIRGQQGIIYVIDGIRRKLEDFNGLDPNVIESISILKDASAVAVYGLDANGAILVTTKKGRNEKTTISYSGSVGVSNNAEDQEWLDGPSYAHWFNQAKVMDGGEEVFTADMVQKMRDGVDGWGNTNWYDKVYATGVRQHHNLSVTGGNDKVNFFTSLGYLSEDGNIDNFDYERLNLRSNIGAKLSNNFTMNLGVSLRVETRNTPAYSAHPDDWHNVSIQTIRALPYVPETMEHEGRIYNVGTRTASSAVSPLGAINESGYNKQNNAYVQSNFSLRYDAPWLDGLSAEFLGSYDMMFQFKKQLFSPYGIMVPDLPTAATTNLNYTMLNDARGKTTSLTESADRGMNTTLSFRLNYDKVFGKHAINVLALAEVREDRSNTLGLTGYGLDFIQLDELDKITNVSGDGTQKYPDISGYSGHTRVAGFVGRVNYGYDEKYLIEASLRYDGSYLFGGMDNKWVALPGVSLGWRIDQEKWFNASWVNSLKIRGGVGKTATSAIKAFQWQNTMNMNENQAVIGGVSQSILYASILGNPNLTWAQCISYNVGVDARLWDGLLGVELDLFYKYEYDKLAAIAGSYPPSVGGYFFNLANVDEADYKGYDITLSHNHRVGDFSYGVKMIWSYSYGRWLKFSGDAENTPDYLKVTGTQIGAKKGFLDDGLFQTEAETQNWPLMDGADVLPGYIKYIDRNGDGEISVAQDMGYVGRSSTPTYTGSFNFFANWKGFDIDLLFSCGLGHDVALNGFYTAAGSVGYMDDTAFTKLFYHGGNSPTYLPEGSWTPENPNAEFPRLSITTASPNNANSSSYWYRSGDYLRLKTAQLGYTLPRKWMNRINVERIRIYVEGYNLLTFSELTKFNIDPESPAVNNGYYPQQRTVSVGLKLTF